MKQVQEIIEEKLVYPLIRGREVKKWYAKRELGGILLPVKEDGETLSYSELRTRYPKTYQYFSNFIKDLVDRSAQPYKSKLRPYRELSFKKAERISPPFYWLFNVKQSLFPYKVVWKEIAGKISGKGEFSAAVVEPIEEPELKKKLVPIPDHKLMLIPAGDEAEAHYLAGILNSSVSQFIVASYTIETTMDTHVSNYIKIPRFDSGNQLHKKLSQLSKDARELAFRRYEGEISSVNKNLKRVEKEIDKIFAKIYGIADKELAEIAKCLTILKGAETEEEFGDELTDIKEATA